MKQKKFKHVFVDSVPVTLQDGVLYVCLKHNTVSHLCACGCAHRIDTPLDPNEWRLTYNGHSISLYPSIGNWDIPCQSHYYITENVAIPIVKKKKWKNKRDKGKWYLRGRREICGFKGFAERISTSIDNAFHPVSF